MELNGKDCFEKNIYVRIFELNQFLKGKYIIQVSFFFYEIDEKLILWNIIVYVYVF